MIINYYDKSKQNEGECISLTIIQIRLFAGAEVLNCKWKLDSFRKTPIHKVM